MADTGHSIHRYGRERGRAGGAGERGRSSGKGHPRLRAGLGGRGLEDWKPGLWIRGGAWQIACFGLDSGWGTPLVGGAGIPA